MKRRLGPPLAGIGGIIAFVAIASGGGGAISGAVGILAIGLALWLVVSWVNRRRPAVADKWQPAAAIAYRPAARHEASTSGAVAATLSRVEARELASSAPFGVGVGLCLIQIMLLGFVWGSDFDGEPLAIPELFPIYVHPLAGMVILATHRARTRSTRDGTQELFDACPTSQTTRTNGHLLTAWVPALTATIFLLVLGGAMVSRLAVVYGALGAKQAALLVGAALLCVGATALGVALARWAPWTPVPIVAIIGIGVLSIRFATAGDRVTEPLRQLSTWLNDPELALRFTAPHWAAHQLWLIALIGLVAVLALARDARGTWVPMALTGFTAFAVFSAIAATRPISTTDATRIAALIDQPATHQECVEAGEIRVCAYDASDALARHLAGVIKPVVEAAPRGALTGWTIRQGTDVEVAQLDPAVRSRLDRAPSTERRLPMWFSGNRDGAEGARFWAALTSVGVTEERPPDGVVDVRNQARGVVALWMATRGADASTAEAMTSFYADVPDYDPRRVRPWPDPCYAGPPPVTWALTDLDAARRLMSAPEDAIAELLRSDWEHLTDPSTSTAELLRAAGLEPVPDRAGQTRAGDQC